MQQNLEPLTSTIPNKIPSKAKIKIPTLILGIIIGSLVTLIGISYLAVYSSNRKYEQEIANYLNPHPTLAPTPSVYTQNFSPTPYPSSNINPGTITWLEYPKVINAAFYKDDPSIGLSIKDIKYQQTGTFSDGSILINAIVPPQGPGYSYIVRFIKTPDGQIYYLTSSNGPVDSYMGLVDNMKTSDIKIPGIEKTEKIVTDRGVFIKYYSLGENPLSFTQLKNPSLVLDTPYGRLYSTYEPSSVNTISVRNLWLRLRDDTIVPFTEKISFMSDNQVPSIKWNDGAVNSDPFNIGFRGKCGQQGGQVLKQVPDISKLAVVGATFGNQSIYQITDPDNSILKYQYTLLNQDNFKPTYSDFVQKHYHFLWQDGLGDWVLFISQIGQIQAECGKPVIYLYPPKDTNVSIKVGANITKSEPLYPSNGWTVLAHSNGQIEYQNQIFPNLFWEGTGLGIYNEHRGEGFVVTQKNLLTTVQSQLHQQGLNNQEISDFMDFWAEKLPTSPYVRLTWLNTADMDRLAPLWVSPQPDTIIRVFLDFEGLKEPIKLVPQKLISPPRNGFTLVEWGGLLVH